MSYNAALSRVHSVGIQELDSLTDLDLTDNLLTRHSDLQPLRNLHNLSFLSLAGEKQQLGNGEKLFWASFKLEGALYKNTATVCTYVLLLLA